MDHEDVDALVDLEGPYIDPKQFEVDLRHTESAAPDRDIEIQQFYREHFARLIAFLLYNGADRVDALDCMHDTIVRATERWNYIRNPYSWCRAQALNCLSKVVKEREAGNPSARARNQFPDARSAAEILEDIQQKHASLSLTRDSLTPRECLLMSLFYDEATSAEIATDLGLPVVEVRAQLREARTKIRAASGKGR